MGETSTAYFERLDETRLRATEHTGGAWREDEQHIAPALGLLAHLVERDHAARREDRLVLARLSYDILGTVPVDVVDTAVRVLRPGRTIELVEASLAHAGRTVATLRAWLLAERDAAAVAGSALPSIPRPEELSAWVPAETWPGGFIRSVEVRRHLEEPGRGWFWVRTPLPLVAGEPVGATARLAGLLDIANGMTVRADPERVHFPNVDLTAHLLREPVGEWLGVDTSVSFGATGVGLTSSRLHDAQGPLGTLAQCLTVRPR
ncbi:thioesterase family protein [Phycicoccus endophyticus]|uniref:Thioesterase family protein n=1 Tax=Phycicoccus endophyticus TaxID=1690220 RepID=A0A7G9R527_9MICO|nr:thioesterase family protein [Phycicoccus endophyticus]NHI20887.1 thioesterase family protein [Phycicoccus endophyticus]QNN50702.1 thioesterase family protein [Phycicoccus endophyticus]GGL22174.1 thioesterase [Phycicoccus endophyticus]